MLDLDIKKGGLMKIMTSFERISATCRRAKNILIGGYKTSKRATRAAYQTIKAYRASPEGSIRGLAREALGIEDPRLEAAKIAAICSYLQARLGSRLPKIILVTGTILREINDQLENPMVISYSEIPHMPRFPDRKGHSRKLIVGNVGDKVVASIDRFHLYEGVTPREIVRLIRALVAFRAQYFIVTNSAGGVNPDLKVGDLVMIKDVINFMGRSPLLGPNIAHFGERCPEVGHLFDEDELGRIAAIVARGQGIPVKSGVYGAVLGPELGTGAAIKMWRSMGADMVGMSTLPEITAVAHMEAYERIKILGLSLITDSRTEDFDILGRSMLLATDEVRQLRQRSVENLKRLVIGTIGHLPVKIGRKQRRAEPKREIYGIEDARLRQVLSIDNLHKVYQGEPDTVSPELFAEIIDQKSVKIAESHPDNVPEHSIKTVKQLLRLLTFDFIDDPTKRSRCISQLATQIDHLSAADLLVLSGLLHDIGIGSKDRVAEGVTHRHAAAGIEIIEKNGILERFGLTVNQKKFVLGLIREHILVLEDIPAEKLSVLKQHDNCYLAALALLIQADVAATVGHSYTSLIQETHVGEVFLKEVIFV